VTEVAPGATSVLILSDKSSGSSVLQDELLKHGSVQGLQKTPHQEGETLFWNKAAALLGLPQVRMIDSRVLPMDARTARKALEQLCVDNLASFTPPDDDRELVFGGWRALVLEHQPVFLEKSPHHIHYQSALDLILEADSSNLDIEFRYLGLVRDPMDTLYSMWRRWAIPPDTRQHEWVRAYRNLLALKERVADKVLLIRYEDLVSDPSVIQTVCRFIGVDWQPEIGASLVTGSIGAWRRDKTYGFRPSQAVLDLASEFGYEGPGDLPTVASWPIRHRAASARATVRRWRGSLLRR
jgi:hypothetical protein